MAAPPATTSSALAHLVHRQWFIMHPWTRVDRWGTGGDASRRYLYTPVSITQADNECRLEGDKTHEIFHFLSKKVGGDISYVVPTKLKSGGDASPPRPPPIYARVSMYLNVGLPLGLTPSISMSSTVPVIWVSHLRLTYPYQHSLFYQVCCYRLTCCCFLDLFISYAVYQANALNPPQHSHFSLIHEPIILFFFAQQAL